MTSTQATIIIPAAAIEVALADMPDSFSAAYTTDTTGAAPATEIANTESWINQKAKVY